MIVRIALDTNILAHAAGINGAARMQAALEVIGNLQQDDVVIPVQVLGELFRLLMRKGQYSAATARELVVRWHDTVDVAPTTSSVLLAAMELTSAHQMSSWDAVVIAASVDAGCRKLLSEDMQNGFKWRGMTIVNPFAAAG